MDKDPEGHATCKRSPAHGTKHNGVEQASATPQTNPTKKTNTHTHQLRESCLSEPLKATERSKLNKLANHFLKSTHRHIHACKLYSLYVTCEDFMHAECPQDAVDAQGAEDAEDNRLGNRLGRPVCPRMDPETPPWVQTSADPEITQNCPWSQNRPRGMPSVCRMVCPVHAVRSPNIFANTG